MEFSRINPNSILIQASKLGISVGPAVESGDVQLITETPEILTGITSVRHFNGPGEYEAEGIMIDGVAVGATGLAYHVLHDGLALAILPIDSVADLTDEVLGHLQPAHILCIWLKQGGVQDFTAVLGRIEAPVVIPVELPFEIADLEKEMQTSLETHAKIRLRVRDLDEGAARRLIDLT